MKFSPKIKLIGLIFLFIVGVFLIIMPADLFDSGKSICLSVILFDLECYGCGMTRAIQHLIHLEFQEAYNYNWLSFLVLPLIIYLYINELFKVTNQIKLEKYKS